MSAIASQITSLTSVYSTVYPGADQSKHQSSASLAFVWGIHRGPVNSPHKWPVTRKMFPFDDVIMKWRAFDRRILIYERWLSNVVCEDIYIYFRSKRDFQQNKTCEIEANLYPGVFDCKCYTQFGCKDLYKTVKPLLSDKGKCCHYYFTGMWCYNRGSRSRGWCSNTYYTPVAEYESKSDGIDYLSSSDMIEKDPLAS